MSRGNCPFVLLFCVEYWHSPPCCFSRTPLVARHLPLYFVVLRRIPALPALLLFSHAMETTGDVSRIICDAWLELRFADPEQGQNQLVIAVKLRHVPPTVLRMRIS
jgi:hypothetical protein